MKQFWLVLVLMTVALSSVVLGDAGCTSTCTLLEPGAGTLYVNPTDVFTMSGCWAAVSGTCPIEVSIYAEFYNGTWNNMTTTGNLSTDEGNPQTASSMSCWDDVATWYVTANDASAQNYAVRVHCYSSPKVNSLSTNATINVSVPATDVCGTLTANKTLFSNVTTTGTCFTIGANDITLDCNGSTITYGSAGGSSSNLVYGVTNTKYNGTTIKGCKIRAGAFSGSDMGGDVLGGIGIYFTTNVWNSTILNNDIAIGGTVGTTMADYVFTNGIYNLTMTNNTAYLDTWVYGIGVSLDGIHNSTISKLTATSTGGSADSYGIYTTGTVKNVSISNSNITLSGSGYALYATSNVQNLTISSSTFNVSYTGSNGIYISGGVDVLANNLTIKVLGSCVSLAGTTNSLFSNSSFECTGNHIIATSYTNNTYFRNVTLNKSSISVTAPSNVTIQWYGRVNVTNSVGAGLTSTINDTDNRNNNSYFGYASLTSFYLVNDTMYNGVSNVLYNNHSIIVNNSGYTTSTTSFNWTGRDYTLNITLYSSSTSSCTYGGSGNWIIQFADRCNITSSQYIYPNNLTFNGTSGYVTFGNPTGATLVMAVNRFFWNATGDVYMWFKNSTWFNGSMGG